MPIKFPCPHCKKLLSVKDHLAGKKGPCPACKKILTVPMASAVAAAPTPPPALPPAAATTNGKSKPHPEPKAPEPAPVSTEDAETTAAAALADEPPPVEETVAPAFVDFNCPMCDEPLHLSAELAGKRSPCPECKRIIKVPEIKKVEKADWRKTNAQGLPSGARRPDEPVPEGAWGTATSASNVSREALEEAEVLPDRYSQPRTLQQKIMRGLLLAAAVASVLVFIGLGVSWWLSSREANTLKSVRDYANSPAAVEKIGREGVAALHIGMGEYHLRSKRADGAKEAQKHFGKAIETLNPQDGTAVKENERDALLTDLALIQTELGGSKDEVEKTTRLKWDEAQTALGRTLRAIHHPEARLDAYRAVCQRLIARKQPERAYALAAQIVDAPAEKAEAAAVAGLELLSANQTALVSRAADDALTPFAQEEDRPTLTTAVAALAVAANREQKPQPGTVTENENDAIGQAEGLARKGEWEPARAKAAQIENNLARLRAYVALAACGDGKSDNPDLASALKLATASDLKSKPGLAWLKLRLADLAARAGVSAETIDSLADSIEERDLAARVRLDAQRSKLAASKNASAETPLTTEPPTLTHYLSVELLARTRRSFESNKAEEAERPFGTLGVLIGGL